MGAVETGATLCALTDQIVAAMPAHRAGDAIAGTSGDRLSPP